MASRRLHLSGVVAGLLLAFMASAVPSRDEGNPYAKIPERNIFGLKEPPAVQVTNNEPTPVLPKLYLTGITTILGNKLALLNVQYPGKPGQPAKEEPLTLAEGQRDGAIEVLNVDEVGKRVRVNNSGTEVTLDFENNGVKPSPAPSAPVTGGPGTPIPAAGGQPPPRVINSTPAVPMPTFQSQPGTLRRTLRVPNSPTTTVPPPPSNAAMGVPAAEAQRQANGTASQLTPEEELILKALGDKGAQVAPQ